MLSSNSQTEKRIAPESLSKITQTLTTRLTSLVSQMKSSQTQTEMLCIAESQTDIPHSRDAWTDINDILSDVKTQTDVFDKTLRTFGCNVTLESTNEKTDKLRDTEVQTTTTLKTEDKITQTSNVSLNDCLVELNTEQDFKTEERHVYKTNIKLAIDCGTQTEKSTHSGDNEDLLNDGSFKDIEKLLQHYEKTTNVALNPWTNPHALKRFSKSLDSLQKYGLISMSNTGSQTDFPFQATFRPVRLFGTLLPTFNLSPMATLLTPLGNLDFCISVVI